MSDKKDFIDKIIDLFLECYKSAKKTDYAIGRGKKYYYPGIERSWVGNLLSIYKNTKPESATETALMDFQKLFNVILSHQFSAHYLRDVTLYKICFKLNEYREAIKNPDKSKKGFEMAQNNWYNENGTTDMITTNNHPVIFLNDKQVRVITKLPEQNIKEYTSEEIGVIKSELLRLAHARDENYSAESVNEWIKCFSELNYSVSMVVKSIRLAKLQPKYQSKEFAMFLNVKADEYYQKYPHKK